MTSPVVECFGSSSYGQSESCVEIGFRLALVPVQSFETAEKSYFFERNVKTVISDGQPIRTGKPFQMPVPLET